MFFDTNAYLSVMKPQKCLVVWTLSYTFPFRLPFFHTFPLPATWPSRWWCEAPWRRKRKEVHPLTVFFCLYIPRSGNTRAGSLLFLRTFPLSRHGGTENKKGHMGTPSPSLNFFFEREREAETRGVSYLNLGQTHVWKGSVLRGSGKVRGGYGKRWILGKLPGVGVADSTLGGRGDSSLIQFMKFFSRQKGGLCETAHRVFSGKSYRSNPIQSHSSPPHQNSCP